MRGLRRLVALDDSDFNIVNKKEIKKMAKKDTINVKDLGSKMGIIEYKMPKAMADAVLKNVKGKKNPQEVLCDWVNTEFGLKGYCVSVIVE